MTSASVQVLTGRFLSARVLSECRQIHYKHYLTFTNDKFVCSSFSISQKFTDESRLAYRRRSYEHGNHGDLTTLGYGLQGARRIRSNGHQNDQDHGSKTEEKWWFQKSQGCKCRSKSCYGGSGGHQWVTKASVVNEKASVSEVVNTEEVHGTENFSRFFLKICEYFFLDREINISRINKV